MKPKIENRTYSYSGYNVCSITATLNIYADDGTTLIDSFGLSASYDITQDDFPAEIARQINAQVSEYLAKLAAIDARRAVLFPTSTDFASAIDQIFDPIQTVIGG